jgi:hypothetical protein
MRGRTRARPSLRIQGQGLLTRPGHRLAQLPLQQRLHQQGEEIRRQETLNCQLAENSYTMRGTFCCNSRGFRVKAVTRQRQAAK